MGNCWAGRSPKEVVLALCDTNLSEGGLHAIRSAELRSPDHTNGKPHEDTTPEGRPPLADPLPDTDGPQLPPPQDSLSANKPTPMTLNPPGTTATESAGLPGSNTAPTLSDPIIAARASPSHQASPEVASSSPPAPLPRSNCPEL